MDFQLKSLSKDAIPGALEKAERYRLLNEPGAAESICLDVLRVEPDNQAALVMLLLSITDQFDKGLAEYVTRARDVLPRLNGEYERAYFAGLVCERRAKAQMKRGGMGAGRVAYEWFREAMEWYEKAEAIRPPGNDDALLRWNSCVRRLADNSDLRPSDEAVESMLE